MIELQEALRQALRQWKMYAEMENERVLKTEQSAEAEIFRAYVELANRTDR